jgi:hypothetical protein
VRGAWGKKKVLRGKHDQSMLHIYKETYIYIYIYIYIYKGSIMKTKEYCLKKGGGERVMGG